MNIFKEYMADVSGVDIFAIVSMLIFLVVFAMILFQTFSLKKSEIMDYKNIPLEDDDEPDDQVNQNLNQ